MALASKHFTLNDLHSVTLSLYSYSKPYFNCRRVLTGAGQGGGGGGGGGGGQGLSGEKNHFFYEFFSKLSFDYKY